MTREELTNSFEYQFEARLLEVANSIYPSDEDWNERDAFSRGADWAKDWIKRYVLKNQDDEEI